MRRYSTEGYNEGWLAFAEGNAAIIYLITILAIMSAYFVAVVGFSETAQPSDASAAPLPGWSLSVTPMPANFSPGAKGEYLAVATNVGEAQTTATPTVLSLTIPDGFAIDEITTVNADPSVVVTPVCGEVGQVVTCTTSEPVKPSRWLLLQVNVSVPALTPEGEVIAKGKVSGGGAIEAQNASAPTAVKDDPIPFDFLDGFVAPISGEEGTPQTLAGSHPFQQTFSFGFPTKNPGEAGEGLTNDGHFRNFSIELPRGFSGNGGATPVLCTEAQLTSSEGCPEESQVGMADVTTLLGKTGLNTVFSSPLFNMVPAPGAAAELATDVAFAGIYVHTLATVRPTDEYRIEGTVRDAIAFGQQPIFNLQAQIWGDPSADSHDDIRGTCRDGGGSCPVDPVATAFLTMPADCPAALAYGARADTWEEPSPPFEERGTTYEGVYGEGNPEHAEGELVELEDCGGQPFEPEIAARPTTNLTDSPAGLDFTLAQPQHTDLSERYSAPVKDLTVRFPTGLAVNPSQAAGLGACSQAQVGFLGKSGERLLFSEAPQSCPEAAKIGTATVTSPLLVARDADHKVQETPEGEQVLEPLHGSLYIAEPFANPFDSLVAIYLTVEDPKTGVRAKLAGEGRLDPTTGQISTRFEENPELPLQRAQVHLFEGSRAPLTTPPTCATHTTTSQLTPWSAPEGTDAFPTDGFALAASPAGGCPTTEAAMPHSPAFSAGTLSPQAGAFSPLLLKLSRGDGSQRWSQIETTLPAGLSAKLAGVGQCSDAAIAKAHSREAPNQGTAELADPSCPPSSELGTLTAAAGSGPNPYYTSGRLYLSGPYKGAPLSAVAIVAAVAGPFDLGTVVVRSALYLDPVTAQARIVSDPFPQILEGVPVDLRSAQIKTDRPGFTLNPTSCDPKSFTGTLTSSLGVGAPLGDRFQLGGCRSLPYKPKLSARLFGPIHRGGHPRFRAILTAKAGEANTGAFAITLPRSEFIDQGHFRTICTRVQYAANQCPPGSIYGYVKAKSPLVDYVLQGPVYLRSSSHKLPDAVAALRGPASQPIAIDAVARIDSVKGRLRSRVQTVPDAPISKVVVTLQGGKKGLFQNSTNICKGTHRISASFRGQNGKAHKVEPALKAQCGKGKGKGGKGKGGGSKKR